MAFDPPYLNVAKEFINQYPSLSFQGMKGLTERELKLSIPQDSAKVVSLPFNNDFTVSQGALKIKALFSSLEEEGVWKDSQGVLPNDYVLASLNLDTIDGITPTALFYRNGWQCRIRKPLWVHGDGAEFDFEAMLGQLDANMKTLLSGQNVNQHRVELEEVIHHHPSTFFQEFRRAVTLPNFTSGITDRHLKVTDICLTSRTGFYVVMKDPQSDSHVLLHGTYDASNFVASNTFTNKNLRLELELEAKGIISPDNSDLSEQDQDAIVNRVFALIATKATPLGLSPFSLSKLEDSMLSAQAHYKRNNGSLPNFSKHLDNLGVQHSINGAPSLHHLYAIVAGTTVRDIVKSLKEEQINSPLAVLAREMPDPRKMLNFEDSTARCLQVA